MFHPRKIYQRLFHAFGPQDWWPGDSAFEIIVGAILTQNTSWTNVEKAIKNLQDENVLAPDAFRKLTPVELAELIRPAGYYRLKSKRLLNFLDYLFANHNGDVQELLSLDDHSLRGNLLAINGIGPETADSIMLYAANKPSFVVDAYTARIWKRHGWIETEANYHQIKQHFESQLESDAGLFNEFHALIVKTGKDFCRPKMPKCDDCPLREFLPENGIIELV